MIRSKRRAASRHPVARPSPARMASRLVAYALCAGLLAAILGGCAPEAPKTIRIAIVVKNLGNGFFDAVRDGGLEAARQLGNVELLYQGPPTPTAEGQIEIIDSLIAQKVDGIAVSANDRDALIPIAKKALGKGIKLISFDSGIAKEGRLVDLVPSKAALIGKQQVELIGELTGWEGEIAILSAARQATNQNAWIEVIKSEMASDPRCAKMRIAAIVYGNDLFDRSYREALGLFESYPRLKGIIAPTTVGLAAAAKAITDQGLIGTVALTGHGLPSEMKIHVESGACRKFALWNPLDLGYTAAWITVALVRKEITGTPGEILVAGRMGIIELGEDVTVMGLPFVFDAGNVARYATLF